MQSGAGVLAARQAPALSIVYHDHNMTYIINIANPEQDCY